MTMLPIHVLVVEDNEVDAQLLRLALETGMRHAQLSHVDTVAGARRFLTQTTVDVVILDLGLPDSIGLDTVREIRNHAPNAPIIVTTGRDDLSIAVIIEVGAQDILVKSNLNSDSIARCIRHALQRKQAEDTIQAAHEALARKHETLEQANQQLRDEIAERLKIENELERAREQAVAANNAKTEFLACMSHELRTPLNAIIGFSDGLLNRQRQHPLNEHQRHRVSRIRDAGQHLLRLINDILDVSRIEAGAWSVDPKPFNLAELVDELTALAEPLKRSKPNISFVVETRGKWPAIESDRHMLKQILLNLLSNAFKFTDVGCVMLTISHEHDTFVFSVGDTGDGMPADKLGLIFEKFQQLNTSSRRVRGGAGLGLAICNQLTHLIGGTLAVQSQPGAGSTFTLKVPRHFRVGRSMQDHDLQPSSVPCAVEAQAVMAA